MFLSPKNGGRLVKVIEPCRLAIALELEFDPEITTYVERPRKLSVDGADLELCFWSRRSDTAESYQIFRRQPKPTVPAVRMEERICTNLLGAAKSAGMPLTIRKPASILANRVANATRLELLPYVQAASGLEGIETLVRAVTSCMEANPISSFYAIERSLCDPFDWRDIRSATCLLIHKGVLSIDLHERLRVSSKVRWKEAAHA
ncbi:hypothetical protein V8246_14890 [Pseudoxanthomonas sp. F11]|uniref:hypothetical protein n=1 Tax=Pseudoxanthomonas sp. F11 TaxID=3126308 RepID=UPI00300D42E3